MVCADCHGSAGNLTHREGGRRGEEGGRERGGGGPMGSVLATGPGGNPGGRVVCADCLALQVI